MYWHKSFFIISLPDKTLNPTIEMSNIPPTSTSNADSEPGIISTVETNQNLSLWLSNKMKFFAFVSMLLLVYVHGYNLNQRYLQPFSSVSEPLTFNAFFQYFIANGLVRFRIPMLFAISGYLYALHDGTPYGKRIAKRFKTLLIPYFLWSIIGLLIAVGLWNWSVTHQAVNNAHLQPIFNKTFDQYTMTDWLFAVVWPTSFQLWFIRCLFFYNVAYPFIKSAVLKAPAVWFTLIAIAWVMMLGFVIVEAEGLLSFSFGVWLAKRSRNLEFQPKWFSLKWGIPAFFCLCAFKTWWAFAGMNWLGEFPHGLSLLIMHKVVIALGLFVAWFSLDKVVKSCMKNRWFVRACSYGFIIYALHVPLITYLIDPVLQLMRNNANARLITFCLLPIAIIAFCMLVSKLLKTFAAPVYSLLTGGRGL